MAFFPQFPPHQAYYPPYPYPNQDLYAMYPGPMPPPPPHPHAHHPHPHQPDGPVYFDQGMMHQQQPPRQYGKVGFANRKDSADSGISDFSASSRKTSSVSTVSAVSGVSSVAEEPGLEDVTEETPYEEPDDDLCEKIAAQVEFYFSDANITKDKFLLKHVRRNKEGFVSLKLISSFKRVKHLTRDWRQVAAAVERKSDKLEVNDAKSKVRRTAALPEYDETTPSRTVVALNLPLERPTIEGVAEIFGACGEIVLVRVLRPGNPVPADVKPFAAKHPEMTEKTCALIEFERTEFAVKAVKELNDDEDEEKMKVMEMTAPPPKTTKSKEDKKRQQQLQQLAQQQILFKQQQQGVFQQSLAGQQQRRFSHAGFNIPPHHPQSAEQLVLAPQNQQQQQQPPRRRISLYHNMKFTPIAEEKAKEEHAGLNPNAPTFQMQQRRLSRPAPPSAFVHPMEAAAAAAALQHQAAAAAAAAAMMQHPHDFHQPSPWMMRRLSLHGQPDFASASGLTLPPNVIRLPRGPDRGKGFQKWCRSRMETSQPQQQPQPQKKKSHAVPIVAPPPEEENKPEEAAADVAEAADVAAADEAQPDGAAAAAEAPAVAAAAPVVDDAAIVVAPAGGDSCSDSGNEDGSVASEGDLDGGAAAANVAAAAAADNERSR